MNLTSNASHLLPGTGSLSELITVHLPAILERQQALEDARDVSLRTDGGIVGTGKADFTTSNIAYEFKHAGHDFQLVDVPGIEGNEEKYSEMVREALAKAHVVFYVNGTNKKPEAETAEKIERYLRHDAVVHPICNIRGKGDTYEYPQDRISLAETHRDIDANVRLTEEVLYKQIGKDVVRPTIVVQGFAALSSLAWSDGCTTLVSERPDLVKSQADLVDLFKEPRALCQFSQIDQLRELLVGYAVGGFRQEIITANRRKVMRRLCETIKELDQSIVMHNEKSQMLGNSVESSVDSIKRHLDTFEDELRQRSHNAIDRALVELTGKVCEIIGQKFSSKEGAQKSIDHQATQTVSKLLSELENVSNVALTRFHEGLVEKLRRMQEDIDAMKSVSLTLKRDGFNLSLGSALESIDFQLGDVGSLLLRMGSYAALGAGIAAAPSLGLATPIGAAIGAAIGAVVEILRYFGFGRDKKIRDTQNKAITLLDEHKEKVRSLVDDGIEHQTTHLREVVTSKVLSPLQDQAASMERAGQILTEQRKRVATIYEQVKEPLNESV